MIKATKFILLSGLVILASACGGNESASGNNTFDTDADASSTTNVLQAIRRVIDASAAIVTSN